MKWQSNKLELNVKTATNTQQEGIEQQTHNTIWLISSLTMAVSINAISRIDSSLKEKYKTHL